MGAGIVDCARCRKPLGNPLTHRCVTGTDFKKRKRQADKPKPKPKPASTGNAHEYAACDDDDCSRFQCRIYKEGVANGTEIGRQLGYADGFPDGIAACPRNHRD